MHDKTRTEPLSAEHVVVGLEGAVVKVQGDRVVALGGDFGIAQLPTDARYPPIAKLFGGLVDLDEDGHFEPYLLSTPGSVNAYAHYWHAQPGSDASYLSELPILHRTGKNWRSVVRTSAASYTRTDYQWRDGTLEVVEEETLRSDPSLGTWNSRVVRSKNVVEMSALSAAEASARIEGW